MNKKITKNRQVVTGEKEDLFQIENLFALFDVCILEHKKINTLILFDKKSDFCSK